METDEIQPRARYECGEALHELERRHHDMGGAVLVRALELQHDIAGVVEFESFVGDSGAGDVAAQLFIATRGRFLELSLTQRDRKWDHPFRRVYLPA